MQAELEETGSAGREPSSEVFLSPGPAGAESGDKARSPMVSLGAGLPPISKKLVERMQADEYIEFSELPPAKGKGRLNTQHGDNHLVVVQAADLLQSKRVIPDLATWSQCYVLYMAVLLAHKPGRLVDLMGYHALIARCSKKFRWPSWVVYDQNFRQDAAGNPDLQWAKVDPSLYAQCFTGQEASRENWCSKCQGLDHQSADCPYVTRKRPWNAGPGAASSPQTRSSSWNGQEICQKFNKFHGDCRHGKNCKYLHACSGCRGPHPISRCKAGPNTQQQQDV